MIGNISLPTVPANITLGTCNNEPVCMKIPLEALAIAVDILSAVANIIHIYIISRLKKKERSIFLTTLYYANVLDVLMSAAGLAGHVCLFRRAMLGDVALAFASTAYAMVLVLTRYATLLFSVIDRWLILSKPFSYKSYQFVRKYPAWLAMITIGPIVYYGTMLTAGRSFACFDSQFGYLFCDEDHLDYCLIIILPYGLVNIPIVIFSTLFFIEYKKLLRRQQVTPVMSQSVITTDQRQANDYVFVSAVIYFIYTATMTLLGTISLQAPIHSLKPLISLENVFYSVLNIFAFFKTTKSYQHKVKEIFLCAKS